MEFHLQPGAPRVYHEQEIKQYLDARDLRTRGMVHIQRSLMTSSALDAGREAQERMARVMAEQLMGKIDWKVYDNLIHDGKTVEGEVIALTFKQLISILGDFGIVVR